MDPTDATLKHFHANQKNNKKTQQFNRAHTLNKLFWTQNNNNKKKLSGKLFGMLLHFPGFDMDANSPLT